jgi:hypothetical protein
LALLLDNTIGGLTARALSEIYSRNSRALSNNLVSLEGL